MSEQKDTAVIGAGYWGKNLVRNFAELQVLKTVCDTDNSVLSQISKDYKDVSVLKNDRELLADDAIHAVVIATPAVTHYDLARKALQAGKHVFVEKPLALTFAEGEHLVDLARERGKILFVGHVLHYHAAVVKLKELVRQGKIGRLQYIYSRRLSLGKIRREENILWSFAPHDISIILDLVGEDPDYIDSVGSNFLHPHIADVTMTNLKFPSGIGAHIFVSWLNPFKEQRLVVVGTEGMIVFDDTRAVADKLVLYPHTIKWQNNYPLPEKAEGINFDLTVHWEEPLRTECRAFIQACETGIPSITSGEEGLKVLRLLEASQRSLEEKEIGTKKTGRIGRPRKENIEGGYFVHDTAIVDEDVIIGPGTKIWHFSHLLRGTSIGTKCNIGQNVVIGPEVTVGNGCKIQNNVSVYKGVTLEEQVFCGPSMVFTNVFNPRAEVGRMDELRPTLIKKGATIGANATIVCGITIGTYAFIGAGAVVTRDVPPYAIYAGNPARQIGWMCRCGARLSEKLLCASCQRQYFLETIGTIEEFRRD